MVSDMHEKGWYGWEGMWMRRDGVDAKGWYGCEVRNMDEKGKYG